MEDGVGGDCDGRLKIEFYSDLYAADVGIDSGEWYDGGGDEDDVGGGDEDGDEEDGCGHRSIQELCFLHQCPVDLWVMLLVLSRLS